ncbi:MAG: hypothetical protein JKX84_08700, partial [Flavobacteriales bacterium]|nr:hypothetical protein [Flavobacteriales bacterium]
MRNLASTFLLCCISIASAIAQQYDFKRFSVEEGLPRSGVYCMLEDSRGFLWVGTQGGGLARFDGRQFITFTTENGLADNTVRALFEDKDGMLWIGTGGHGLSRYDGSNFTNFDTENGLSSNYIRCITQGDDGDIWIGTFGGGINRLRFTEDSLLVTVFNTESILKSNKVRTALRDSHGKLWFGTDEGLCQFDGQNWNFYDKTSGLSHNRILTLFEDNTKNLWIGTQNGLNKKVGQEFMNYSTEDGLIHNRVRAISQDNSGNMWFGTQKGVTRFDGKNFISFTEVNGLSNDRIRFITSDRSGNMWFGTYFGGICRFSGEEFFHFTEIDGITNNQVLSVYNSNDGEVWLGTLEGITELKPQPNGTWKGMSHPLGTEFADRNINVITKTPNNEIWFGTDSGIIIKNQKQVTRFSADSQPYSENVKVILFEPNGDLWLGTDQGVTKFKNTENGFVFNQYHSNSSIHESEVSGLEMDDLGRVWIIYRSASLVIFENNEFVAPNLPKQLTHIAAMRKDPFSNIWFATEGNGLFKFRLNKKQINQADIEHVGSSDGLSSSNLNSLVFDDDNNLWIGTVSGIDRVSFKTDAAVRTVKHFGRAEGFTGIETNQNATALDAGGNLWFGTITGVTRYSEKLARKNLVENPIHITNVGFEFENIDWTSSNRAHGTEGYFSLPKELELPYSSNGLEISYLAINLHQPEQVRYQWRLDGYSTEWSLVEDKSSHSFTNLSPGKYTFNVRSTNSEHIWNGQPATFTFTVLPPIWMTWWFITISILLLILFIRGMIKFREKELLAEKKKLEIKVNERTKELRHEKERSDELLLNILPSETAEELKLKGYASVRFYERVSVLFTDFVGFTTITEGISHEELVRSLDEHFCMFDEIMDRYGVEKIKTIGDAYMAAGGIPTVNNANPLGVVMAGLEMIQGLSELNNRKKLKGEVEWELRLGIHTGSVISGVVGKNKFAFDIWGDAVNTAARMESSGSAMKVNISGSTYQLIKDYFECTARGKIKAKNKGEIEMFFVDRLKPEF